MYISICNLIGRAAHLLKNLVWLFILSTNIETQCIIPGESRCVLQGTPSLRPSYICIDKACMVLRTAISNHSWDIWKETSRFIVDSYHYINHHTSDYLCRKWCNPAPLNGSAPNLVVVENDLHGNPHYKCAFNTQV